MNPQSSRKPINKFILILIIVLVSAAVIIGAWHVTADRPAPIVDPTQLYATALTETSMPVYYRVDGSKTFTLENSDITETFCRYITVEHTGTPEPHIYIDEYLTIGNHNIQNVYLYYNGTEYLTVQGANFKTAATAEEFQSKCIPYTILTPTLYGEVSGVSTKSGAEITFTGATAVEEWAVVEDMEFHAASGKAHIDNNGHLIKSEYDLEYYIQETYYHISLIIEAVQAEPPALSEPDSSLYHEISDITIPIMIEKACGYLTAAPYLYAEYEDIISCQAFGDDRMQIAALEISKDTDWYAKMDTEIAATNTSKAGSINTQTTTEIFKNGSYTVSVNNGKEIPNPDIDLETMENHCHSLLVGTIILPQDIASYEISQSKEEGYIYLEFQATEAFANALAREACTTLYQSDSILDDMAESYKTNSVTCYITMEMTTGFPYASGFYYSGTHTISGIPYELSFSADQSYAPVPFILSDNEK